MKARTQLRLLWASLILIAAQPMFWGAAEICRGWRVAEGVYYLLAVVGLVEWAFLACGAAGAIFIGMTETFGRLQRQAEREEQS